MLAPGQHVWSVQTSFQSSANRFSNFGRVEPLGRRFDRAVTWRRLLAAQTSVSARAEMENLMRQSGARPGDVAATSSYDLSREDLGVGVDWAYGLTPSWTIGLQIPVVMRTVNVDSRVDLVPSVARQGSVSPLATSAMKARVKALAEQELATSGYDAIPNQQREWVWGDVSLMSHTALLSGYDWDWSAQQFVRFPTSRNPSVADYFQSGGDDGQLDLGLTSLLDYRMRRWTLGLRFGFVMQLPDSAKMRVGAGQGTEVEYTVDRDLGDWTWGSFDADFRMTSRLLLNAEYAVLAKSEDRYHGGRFTEEDYALLGEGTAQELHQTRLGVLYSLGDRAERSGIESKWTASLGYTYPWLGRNSLDASRASIELINYF